MSKHYELLSFIALLYFNSCLALLTTAWKSRLDIDPVAHKVNQFLWKYFLFMVQKVGSFPFRQKF